MAPALEPHVPGVVSGERHVLRGAALWPKWIWFERHPDAEKHL